VFLLHFKEFGNKIRRKITGRGKIVTGKKDKTIKQSHRA
jgi:hypothetical protein